MAKTNETQGAVPASAKAPADAKGHATPKRKQQEAARKRPIVVDMKMDAKERKALARAEREKENHAMAVGNVKDMPLEHRQPDRVFIRDWVDAKFSLGEWTIPLSFVFFIVSFVSNTSTKLGIMVVLGFYGLVALIALETTFNMRRLRKALIAKFGGTKGPRGWIMYAVPRALQIRRVRLPRPNSPKRGSYPS